MEVIEVQRRTTGIWMTLFQCDDESLSGVDTLVKQASKAYSTSNAYRIVRDGEVLSEYGPRLKIVEQEGVGYA